MYIFTGNIPQGDWGSAHLPRVRYTSADSASVGSRLTACNLPTTLHLQCTPMSGSGSPASTTCIGNANTEAHVPGLQPPSASCVVSIGRKCRHPV
ncbi:hypothetical protein FKM82_017609 [Ascaphus truei]